MSLVSSLAPALYGIQRDASFGGANFLQQGVSRAGAIRADAARARAEMAQRQRLAQMENMARINELFGSVVLGMEAEKGRNLRSERDDARERELGRAQIGSNERLAELREGGDDRRHRESLAANATNARLGRDQALELAKLGEAGATTRAELAESGDWARFERQMAERLAEVERDLGIRTQERADRKAEADRQAAFEERRVKVAERESGTDDGSLSKVDAEYVGDWAERLDRSIEPLIADDDADIELNQGEIRATLDRFARVAAKGRGSPSANAAMRNHLAKMRELYVRPTADERRQMADVMGRLERGEITLDELLGGLGGAPLPAAPPESSRISPRDVRRIQGLAGSIVDLFPRQ